MGTQGVQETIECLWSRIHTTSGHAQWVGTWRDKTLPSSSPALSSHSDHSTTMPGLGLFPSVNKVIVTCRFPWNISSYSLWGFQVWDLSFWITYWFQVTLLCCRVHQLMIHRSVSICEFSPHSPHNLWIHYCCLVHVIWTTTIECNSSKIKHGHWVSVKIWPLHQNYN